MAELGPLLWISPRHLSGFWYTGILPKLGVVNNEKDIIPTHFFPQGLKINGADYKRGL